jgi:hypothetical protein
MVVWIAVPRADLHAAHRGVGAGEGQVETGTVSTDTALLVSGTRNSHHHPAAPTKSSPQENADAQIRTGSDHCHRHPRRSYRAPADCSVPMPLRIGTGPLGTRRVHSDRRCPGRNGIGPHRSPQFYSEHERSPWNRGPLLPGRSPWLL